MWVTTYRPVGPNRRDLSSTAVSSVSDVFPALSSIEKPRERPLERRGAMAIEPSPMGDDDPLRIPPDHGFEYVLQHRPLLAEGEAHVARHAAIGRQHATEPAQQTHERRFELLGLEVLDEISEDQRSAWTMEEVNFRHKASHDRQGRNRLVPWITLATIEQLGAVRDTLARLLRQARSEIDLRLGVGALPIAYPPVVKTVWPDDPAWPADSSDFPTQPIGERSRRMDKEAVAGKAQDRHARRKRYLWPRHAKADDRAIDDPQIPGDGFECIDRGIGFRHGRFSAISIEVFSHLRALSQMPFKSVLQVLRGWCVSI